MVDGQASPGPTLVLSRSTLRPLRREDAPSIATYADNPRIWRNLRDAFPHPYQLRDAEAFIASQSGEPTLAFAIEVGGEAVGVIGLIRLGDVERGTMEIGYWLGEPFWGRGIATEAVAALSEHAFATFGVERIEAKVFGWNRASARVLEKAGYTFEGRHRRAISKDGLVTDGLMYALVR